MYIIWCFKQWPITSQDECEFYGPFKSKREAREYAAKVTHSKTVIEYLWRSSNGNP